MMMMRRRRSGSSTLLCTLLLLSLLLCFFFQLQPASAHGGIDDDHDTPPSSSSAHHHRLRPSKGLIAVKVWCLFILLVVTFVGGVSPYFYRWNEAFLLLGTQFAAGVFLGTALMHFLADSTSTFRGLTKNRYPFSYMLACVGFLLTMLADSVVAAAVTTNINNNKSKRGGGGGSQIGVVVNDDGEAAACDDGGAHNRHQITNKEEGEEAEAAAEVEAAQAHHQAHHHGNPMFMLVSTTSPSPASFEDAVLLILALCFHSVFEGIAIGVSASKSDAWRNLWTIGLHKVLAAVAMGIALLRMIPRRPLLTTVAYSLAFAVSSPLGVAIGIGIDATAEGRAADWTFAVAMGFATGVFLYVAINHLIAKGYRAQEPTRVDRASFKFIAVLLGVAVMAVLMIWG